MLVVFIENTDLVFHPECGDPVPMARSYRMEILGVELDEENAKQLYEALTRMMINLLDPEVENAAAVEYVRGERFEIKLRVKGEFFDPALASSASMVAGQLGRLGLTPSLV